MSATKAAARRWLNARVGQDIDTVQVRPDGMSWRPGARTLAKDGTVFTLDGSRLIMRPSVVVLEVTDDALQLEFQDDDGVTIHVTTYRPIREEEED